MQLQIRLVFQSSINTNATSQSTRMSLLKDALKVSKQDGRSTCPQMLLS